MADRLTVQEKRQVLNMAKELVLGSLCSVKGINDVYAELCDLVEEKQNRQDPVLLADDDDDDQVDNQSIPWEKFMKTGLVDKPETIKSNLNDLLFKGKYRAAVIYGPGRSGKSLLKNFIDEMAAQLCVKDRFGVSAIIRPTIKNRKEGVLYIETKSTLPSDDLDSYLFQKLIDDADEIVKWIKRDL